MGPTPVIASLVLAAGASERMGRPKALLSVAGRPAVEVVAGALASAGCGPIVVVVGRHAEEIRSGADLSAYDVLDHAGWADGRTSSIQAGLAAVPKDAGAVVLALVDMPLVRPETVRAVVDAWLAIEPRGPARNPRGAGDELIAGRRAEHPPRPGEPAAALARLDVASAGTSPVKHDSRRARSRPASTGVPGRTPGPLIAEIRSRPCRQRP